MSAPTAADVHEQNVPFYSTPDYKDIVTPINVQLFKRLLLEANYDKDKTQKLISGFEHGFNIGYAGPMNRKDESENIPFAVGDAFDMWEKIMKEVSLGRYAGPFTELPFEYFVQ